MAKYTHNYACGHGEREVQLYGPHKERDRKLAWMAKTLVCPECYRAQREAADAAAPKRATVTWTALLKPEITVSISGQIEANKAALYELGYEWRERLGGALDMLSMSRTPAALSKTFAVGASDQFDAAKTWLHAELVALQALGYDAENASNVLDSELFRRGLADLQKAEMKAKEDAEALAAARAGRLAADPRPPRPEAIDQLNAKHADGWGDRKRCNGKIYGSSRGRYSYYVDGAKFVMADDDRDAIESWRAAMSAWRARNP